MSAKITAFVAIVMIFYDFVGMEGDSSYYTNLMNGVETYKDIYNIPIELQ
jgi:hypothetical protein